MTIRNKNKELLPFRQNIMYVYIDICYLPAVLPVLKEIKFTIRIDGMGLFWNQQRNETAERGEQWMNARVRVFT